MYTVFTWLNCSMPRAPASRNPLPVCFVPPKGSGISAPMVGALT